MLISENKYELLVAFKVCNKCREEKPLSEYWNKAAGRDGLDAQCKDCAKVGRKQYRKSEAGMAGARKHNAKSRQTEKGKITHRKTCSKWQKTDSGKASHKAANDRYKEKYPERPRAGELVAYALHIGELTRTPCVLCGEVTVEGHHPDYSNPLEVIWLCNPCHNKEHQEV